jgi:hypothetical protein
MMVALFVGLLVRQTVIHAQRLHASYVIIRSSLTAMKFHGIAVATVFALPIVTLIHRLS